MLHMSRRVLPPVQPLQRWQVTIRAAGAPGFTYSSGAYREAQARIEALRLWRASVGANRKPDAIEVRDMCRETFYRFAAIALGKEVS